MEYVIGAAGHEWVTNKEYLYKAALELNDDGKTSLSNERARFVINHYFTLKPSKKTKKVRKTPISIGSLSPLSQEMKKFRLSDYDEEYLDDIIGNDPYTPLY